jgi:hypothetical protein
MQAINYYYWLSLFGFILFLSLISFVHNEPLLISICEKNIILDDVHPFLCEKKINLKNISLADLRVIGIPASKAQSIKDFLVKNPEKKLEDLTNIRGIGPKNLLKLKEYFF